MAVNNRMQGIARRAAGALMCVTAAGIASGISTMASAQEAASAAEAQQRFQIPAGSLEAALTALARQSGVLLVYLPELTRGQKTSGLSGEYSVRDALTALLSDTDLEATSTANGSYTLQRRAEDGALKLPAVRVEGRVAAENRQDITEGSGSYTTPAITVAGKTARDPRQIQQSVSVVTAQRIRDQVMTTTEDALAQVTGVTLTQGSGYTTNASFTARGFAMGIQTDGGAVGVNNIWYQTGLPDLAVLDHVEVLRGSDALFAGSGAPGGVVNVVRKRPVDQPQVLVDALVGSWDRVRTQVDVSAPLGWNDRLRGRFVFAEEKRDYFYDTVDSEKTVLYGVTDADLTDSTLLTVGVSYEQFTRNGLFFGLPRFSTGEDLKLPREACLCTQWSGRHDESRELFAKLNQALSDDWNLKVNLSQQWLDYDYTDGNATGGVDPLTGLGALMQASQTDVSNTTKLADVSIDGRFAVFGVEQEVVMGFNWQDMYSDGDGVGLYDVPPPVDVFAFNPADYARPGVPDSYTGLKPFGGQRQSGYYVTVRSQWTDRLSTTVGMRSSSFKNRYTAGNMETEYSDIRTPYAGASYDLSASLTAYTSYAQIYAPQAYYFTESGDLVDPSEGDTYELGVKGAWLDGALNGYVAVYRIEEKNRAQQVSVGADWTCCYATTGAVESRGIDAEVSGQLLPGWELSLGYTFNINEYTSGDDETNGTSYNSQTPKHLLKLWSMLRLPGDGANWRVGGGVNWQSRNYQSGSAATYNPETDRYDGPAIPFEYSQDAYAVVGLRGEYAINATWTAALNVNNLLDETYYQTVSTSNTGNYYGEPRNWTVSLSGRW